MDALKEDLEKSEGSACESDIDPETPITEPQTPLGSGRKILPCPYQGCAKSYNRQARLSEHVRSHTNERPFKCLKKECGKAFLRDSHLKHHIKSAHTNERNYLCTWANCDKKFATGTRLRRHESSHEKKESYTCKGYDECSETFRKHATLARHILVVHENKKPFQCTELGIKIGEQCTLGFDTAEKLRSHKRAVHDGTRFVCMDCPFVHGQSDSGVTFATYALLQHHIAQAHPPTCPRCFLPCASEKDLRRHLELTHSFVDLQAENSSSPSFPCTYLNCSRSFLKKGNLNVHIKTVHEHRKDFVCGETELKLPIQKSENQNPILAGTSEISGCGRHFTSKATLEEHIRTVHLGMKSRRQERNRKRRAERAAVEEDAEAERGGRTKRRKPQTTKSAIEELTGSTGFAVATSFYSDAVLANPLDEPAYPTEHDSAFHQDIDRHPFRLGYDNFLTRDEPEEERFAKQSLSVGFDDLAASALVDPVLLSG